MNSILERTHQLIINLARTFFLQNNYLYKDDSWAGTIAETAFFGMTYVPYNVTIQLVFVRDITLTTPDISDWEAIGYHKQKLIDKITKTIIKYLKTHKYILFQRALVRNKIAKTKIKFANRIDIQYLRN